MTKSYIFCVCISFIMQTLSGFLSLIAGLGVFLIGMKITSEKLQNLAGGKVGEMLKKLSGSRIAGIGIGAGAGMILESSSATTVILLSLVDAGIISLIQATLIIMGANIGTTLSVLLFSLNSLPIGAFIAVFAMIGICIVMGAKKEKTRNIGWIVAAVGLIFVGLSVMSDGVGNMQASATFVAVVQGLSNPFLLVAFGVVFTAVIQSGSATTGIVIALCESSVMPITSAFYIIIGSNIGSCITAIIGSLGAGINAKRTALIHLIFNAAGAVIFTPLMFCFGNSITVALGGKLSTSVSIAYFHIVFNLVTTIILLPFVKRIVALAEWILPEKKDKIKTPISGVVKKLIKRA